MPVDVDLIARSGELKRELVAFSRRPRFASAFRDACNQRASGKDDPRNVVDRFVLEHELPDGFTVVDHFVKARATLTETEKQVLLGWRDVVEGIFEVERHDGEALIAINLIDEMTYRIRSTMGSAIFADLPHGALVLTRLVPVADEWLFSGATNVLPVSERATVLRAAATIAMRHPALVFRNPEKLARAWDLQRRDRDRFIEHFGSDLVVVAGRDLASRLQDYRGHCTRDAGAGDPPGSAPAVAADLHEAATVGMIYDEIDGLDLCANFGLVDAAFADPSLIVEPVYRHAVLGYLEDDRILPLPLRRLAARDPNRASRLFQTLLEQPHFRWDQDGETLLRERKPQYFNTPRLPKITPLGDTLARSLQAP